MGRVEGKVAFITGAARSQGRSHGMATAEDLQQTVKEVEALDPRIVAVEADVRDFGALKAAVDDGVAQLGRLDIVSANAGILSYGRTDELSEESWRDTIDINLSGVWNTAKAAIPAGVLLK